MNDRDQLISASLPFLAEVQDMTAGTEVERWLNATHGPGSTLYEELAALVKAGVRDGWAANIEIDGPRYRRSRICDPSAETLGFSITAVYMSSNDNPQRNPGDSYRGQYHAHPYGEFNMVVPLDESAALAGPNGWCHAGWTAPAPGSHHYPEVRRGAVIALFFLPAGRISYNVEVPDSLPAIPD
ncbi:DUF4863 family protein [Variovorax sp. KK3]|uniref:DUF4863 family protein n=1 Tax=Variovorax sp. KK3 TaxID=1855728 RepID=UPI00097BACC1|nr:DUF4863 family protein [Variovorax sp. KK3]